MSRPSNTSSALEESLDGREGEGNVVRYVKSASLTQRQSSSLVSM